jgi:CubicO group peptidase (beta-lactamase class C family)
MSNLRLLGPFVLAVAALPARSQQPSGDSVRIAINRAFATWTTTEGPGCAVGASRNGIRIFENGYGMANLEHGIPITPASIFHVASVSKQFTAAAIMLLARDGKLSLDDDVRKHVPEVPAHPQTITIRHLLQHTSGLRDQWDLLIMSRGRFEEDRVTEDDVLEIVGRQKALNFEPGAEYLYSNTGYTLAGTIVRRVSGKSLREFADERLFRPLGMTETHFHDDYTMIVKNRAAGYARQGNGWRVSLPNYDTYGATSLFTTVGDLLKWAANFDRPVVGDEAMLRAMQTSGLLANGDTTGYGLGLGIGSHRGTPVISHGGADAGYRTFLGRFPEHGFAIAVLCNASTANPSALAHQVADVVLRDRLSWSEPAMTPPVAMPAETLAPYAGVYAHPVTGQPLFVTLRRDTLVLGRVNGPGLVPLAEARFRAPGAVELRFTGNGLIQSFHASPSRQPVTYRRERAVRPTPAELAAYAGTYYSEELGATYVVTATDSTLSLRTRMGEAVTVRPAYLNVFDGRYLLRFTRDRNGRVTGFGASTGRVRNVRFERVVAPPRPL